MKLFKLSVYTLLYVATLGIATSSFLLKPHPIETAKEGIPVAFVV